jgi:hypothetical protein
MAALSAEEPTWPIEPLSSWRSMTRVKRRDRY